MRACFRLAFPCLLSAGLLVGCADELGSYQRTISTAFEGALDTRAGQLFEDAAAGHPGKSGFAIIRHGRQAFTARIAFTELAEHSLDVQYYIWEGDATGFILMDRLVRAADRGVRVRVLVDDINLTGRDDRAAALDAHANIEVHIFNPFRHRDSRLIDFAVDLGRVNHRMHNKLIVVDNAMAIVGGRNIGNHYFDVASDANFRDLDIAAAGPVVPEISEVFDHFWNGDWAVPISALVDRTYTEADLEATVAYLREQVAALDYPHPLDQDVESLISDLTVIGDQFVWAPGRIVWDDPRDIAKGIAQGAMVRGLLRTADTLKTEILIESAYFVTPDFGMDKFVELVDRNVRVRVLTNSLASNDVIAAHAGHAKHRKQLVESGVELYELRPDAGSVGRTPGPDAVGSSLHTKAVVFDRQSVFIGSFNLDPRSGSINTEAGLYVESPVLAEQVVAFMDEGVKLENSFRVQLDDDGELVWVTEVDGVEVRFDHDPYSSFWERLVADLIALLPVEDQL